jgi:phage terminase large subunit GpA-like protein
MQLEQLRTASAAALVADAFEAFLPPPPLDVADWTAENRWVSGARAGRWDHSTAPYLVEPMRATTSPLHTTTCLVGPGQSGKTAVGENLFLASVDRDPGPLLWYLQTDDALRAYVKDRINPLIEQHETVRAKKGLRPVDDSIGYKRFNGMSAQFLAAARSNLINKTARRIIGDEWDAWDPDFGDPLVQLDTRRQSYGRDSMLLAMSHCDRAEGAEPEQWNSGIMALYRESDRRTWWWPCPHCNGWSSPNPTASRVMALTYPEDAPLDEIADAASLACPCCGVLIADKQRRAMNQAGRWIGLGQTIDINGGVTGELVRRDVAGFWIVGVMSPFLLAGIGGLAAARVKAEREFRQTGEDTTLREVVVKQWGLPYAAPRQVGSVDADTLVERAEDLPLGKVSEGVRFLTAFLDVQANRFELLVRGWGESFHSWIVDYAVIRGEPATNADDWDRALERALRPVPLADGSGRVMRIRACSYDSGGAPGVTQQAYSAWRRWRAIHPARVRNLGQLDGRDAWSLLPAKGLSGPNAQRLAVMYPEGQRKDRTASAGGLVPLLQHNPNLYKDDLAGQLATAEGQWRVHIPAALKAEEPPHPFFEGLVAEQRTTKGTWERIRASAANEPIDLMVGTHAAADLHGLRRLRWDAPPAWAATWDRNAMIELPGAMQDASGPAAPMPPSRPSAPALLPPGARVAPVPSATPPAAAKPGFLSRFGRMA